MHSNDDITSRILSSLANLPIEEQAEAILTLISSAMKGMSVCRILEIRQEIWSELDPQLPVVAAALDLIEGQLALRQIGAEEGWR